MDNGAGAAAAVVKVAVMSGWRRDPDVCPECISNRAHASLRDHGRTK